MMHRLSRIAKSASSSSLNRTDDPKPIVTAEVTNETAALVPLPPLKVKRVDRYYHHGIGSSIGWRYRVWR
jgi:hypothetical protein